ncbi:ABC transporter substrate-binding protein [Natronorubrum texcoconense]|uniref:Amino acid/amide ABC transporter substrate-binding protein, HAAT family n=1 Tax=Natronorubrum texcoconense TaxID=1095776 RepID=A0A1G9D6Y5_9EURY|nr:ABC transporter substrate-binding protein [Natronorubrum texcoconense]SDK59613.1 amino acid/amide ABC transporter substrate-binding protein, HAAT family [Natronorubrum texcoconense]
MRGNQRHITGVPGKLNRRQFVGLAGIGATTSLAGCIGGMGDSDDDDEIKIGLLAYDPGSAPQGTAQQQAAELAVSDLNDDGGVLDEDVELLVADTQGSSSTASDRYLEFVVEENVDVTAGVFVTEVMTALMSDIADHQTVHMSGGHTSPTIAEMLADDYEQYKYQFRPYGNATRWIESISDLAAHMQEEEDWDQVAILCEEFEWTQSFTNALPDLLEDAGLEVVYNERYPADTENFTPLFDNIEGEDADAVVMAQAHSAGPAMIQWRDEEREFSICGQISQIVDPGSYEAFDGDNQYAISNAPAVHTADLSEHTTAFAERYNDEFDVYPNDAFSYATYDGIMMWAEVVEELGTTDSEEVVPALADASYVGTRGRIEFNDEDHEYPHDAKFGEDYLRRINFQWQEEDDGEGLQQVIHPEDLATSEYQEPEWF